MNFTPVVYEHAARFIARSPWDVSRDAILMAKAHIAAYHKYNHSPITVGIDIYNLEPEAYGAVVDKPDGNEVPAIKEAFLKSTDEILKLPELDINTSGRWPLVIEAAGLVKRELPEADIRLPLSGAYSIAANLTGFEPLLIASFTEVKRVGDALSYLAENQLIIAEQIIDQGFGISLFESAATPPLLSPALVEKLIVPSLQIITKGLFNKTGQHPACILGGDNALITEALGNIGAGFLICPAETDQDLFLKNIENMKIPVRINMSVENFMYGNWPQIKEEIERIKSLMKRYPFTLAGSGILPYNADPDLIFKIRDEFKK